MGTTKPTGVVQEVLALARDHSLWSPGDRIVVAVSGGPDSVALLHILHEISVIHMPLQLICAHVHHGFRPEESDAEAEEVRSIARKLEIPFEMIRVDVPVYMKESGKGPQEAARELRYSFLHDTAAKWGAQRIAMAHHGDDQAETVLLHLLRGSGPAGLAGMRLARTEKNVQLIRPLLRMYKADLIEFCRFYSLSYVTDSTNLTSKYRRNAIRMDVLPFLGQYNEQLTPSLNRLAETMAEENDFMEASTLSVYEELVRLDNGRYMFSIASYRKLPVALQRRLIKLILNYLPSDSDNFDFRKIETVRLRLLQEQPSTWSLDLGGGAVGVREYDQAGLFDRTQGPMGEWCYGLDVLPMSGELELPEAGGVLRWRRISYSDGPYPANEEEAWFDADELSLPLTIRSRLPGDAMHVMGLNGRKKVKDIFIDGKIPPSLRSVIPIVCDQSGAILWIPGVRRSVHAAVQKHTSSVIYMSWQRRKSPGHR
ncbi:tRNA lysidine(34) synthetase TilS [Paenibacillus kribbensis]|uniref:tRNA(Ile)-lysidine synthase n=1 Tax=Paenibacillus kribbensis TaxID=172713 RepID=A0A222WV71_9BACL|nr:tRNA lysidine(34) synthetase TilS [Paenibacillus kribbensis]ASR49691.1 tRNA lysidine(34) synthetase TilS [Paenibacillus kribbensis]MEC0236778.1 tRNA lysidine(34) synthetase TilS [Paenibacillus kribbensis]